MTGSESAKPVGLVSAREWEAPTVETIDIADSTHTGKRSQKTAEVNAIYFLS